MTVIERPRLRFDTDLSDPTAVYHLPEHFVHFLKENERDREALEFLDTITNYMSKVNPEDYSLEDICTIASWYADIFDFSGVPFDENIFLKGAEDEEEAHPVLDSAKEFSKPAKSAEEVLEDLDRDMPTKIEPKHPDVILEFTPHDEVSLSDLVYAAIFELRRHQYRKSADRIAREIRQATRTDCHPVEILRIIDAYISVEYVD